VYPAKRGVRRPFFMTPSFYRSRLFLLPAKCPCAFRFWLDEETRPPSARPFPVRSISLFCCVPFCFSISGVGKEIKVTRLFSRRFPWPPLTRKPMIFFVDYALPPAICGTGFRCRIISALTTAQGSRSAASTRAMQGRGRRHRQQ